MIIHCVISIPKLIHDFLFSVAEINLGNKSVNINHISRNVGILQTQA